MPSPPAVFAARCLSFAARFVSAVLIVVLLPMSTVCSTAGAADVRDRAVVSVTFDDLPSVNSALTGDSAKNGKVADVVSLTNYPTRTVSVFAPGAGYAVMLNPVMQQQVSMAHSEDVSRGDAVSVTGFFASLHPLNESGYRALFAKRQPGAPSTSNFGINYEPASDNLQLYVNDGTGYKVVHYSVKATVGFRRRVHIAVCLDHGDAPGADADPEVDDIRARLFVNGTVATPTRATGGLVDGSTGWLQDVSLTKCVSDTPVTIGSSFLNGELTRLICDDIHLFAESLSEADVAALYREVAGAAADDISKEQSGGAAAAVEAPEIVRISPHAVEIGKTARLVVAGRNLDGARLHTGVPGVTIVRVAEGSHEGQAIFDVSVDATVVPGRYAARCVTSKGVSNRLVLALDRVPGHSDGTFTDMNPATAFPVSVHGLIGGTEQKRVWFRGSAGQKVVAEVEARRIGSMLDPVIEIKSQSGAPLMVQWQQSELSGDARAAVTLPSDGLYIAEVHDLQFAAPGGSPWRLLLGDLPPASLAFPPSISASAGTVRTVAADAVSEPLTVRKSKGRLAIESGTSVLPLPSVRAEAGTYVTEPIDGPFAATPIDATMLAAPFSPLFLNGRIAAAKEKDSVLLTVTPGQTLHFAAAARGLSSSLRAKMLLYHGDLVVAQSDGDSGASDPQFSFAVPDKVTQLRLEVSDLNGKGSASSIYRVEVSRVDRPAFTVTTSEPTIRLPLNGSLPLRLNIRRISASYRYTGPIRLSLSGSQSVTIVPEVIPPSDQDQVVIAMLTRSATASADAAAAGQGLKIEARADGADPVYMTTVEVDSSGQSSAIRQQLLTLPDDEFVAGPGDSVPATILLESAPPILFRGLPAVIPVRVVPLTEMSTSVVRFEMITTEPERRTDPNKPDSPLKPMVALEELQFGNISEGAFSLGLRVPADTPHQTISAAISAEFVTQPLAPNVGSKAWTAPMILTVTDAAAITLPADPVKGKKATVVMVPGQLRRHAMFTDPVTVLVDGLPEGWSAMPVPVAAGQNDFTLAIAVPENAGPGGIPDVLVRVQHANGASISQSTALKLVVE
ncbi:MAG: hypothetical protein ACK58L_14725 [Planctomycetota bacterium]